MDTVFGKALEKSNNGRLEQYIGVAEIFRGSDKDTIARLARSAHERCYASGETVFARGERPHGVLLVAEGTLKLSLRGANGEQKVVALVEEGRCCACAPAFLDRASALEAIAHVPATVVSIPASAVFGAMEHDVQLARRVLEHLSHRVLSLVDEVEGVTLRRGLGRIAHYIESLLLGNGPGAQVVRLPSTKTLIAARLGIAKETLSRLLHELAEKGVISVVGRDLYIRDRAALAALALGRANGNGNGSGRGGPLLEMRE